MTVRPELVAFDARPYRHRLGLRTIPESGWLDPDGAAAWDLGVKRRRLVSERDRVRLGSPGRAEDLLVDALPGAHGVADGDDRLAAAAAGIQEDLVVLERSDAWRFTSGVVCFPTAWEPREKLGKPVLAIHDPVPGYADQVGAAVDRYLDRLAPGEVQWRRNWSLVATDDLWLRPGGGVGPIGDVGTGVWLRIERQTFRKLADDVIVFGIRVHRWTLDEGVGATAAAGLATQIRTMPPELREYKELLSTHTAPLLAWLDERAATGRPGPG